MNILFLDDMPSRHELIAYKANELDICVSHVWTVDEAIDSMRDNVFDIVMLDYDLNDFSSVTGKKSVAYGTYSTEYLNGMTVARWMINNKYNCKKVIVHSMNVDMAPIMAKFMEDNGYDVVQREFNNGIIESEYDYMHQDYWAILT